MVMLPLGEADDDFDVGLYSQVIRITPTRFLPWHGRTMTASASRVIPQVAPDPSTRPRRSPIAVAGGWLASILRVGSVGRAGGLRGVA